MLRVEIGLLFSRSGSYQLIAEACRAGALRAIADVNADPSLALEFVPVERDPGGEADAYAPLCAEILTTSTARHVVGCVTSWSRKEVIPTLERLGGFLWYPCPYEGFEASSQVVYVHACPNQHLVPLLRWASIHHGRRGYLTGSNYIWGWEMNRVARDLILEGGGEVLGERYLPIGDTDVGRLIEEIQATRPDFVLNNLIGASSYEFMRALRRLAEEDARFGPDRCPVLSCNLTECELPALGEAAEGLVSAGPYFRDSGGRFGSSFEAAAYASVRSLAARLERAGNAGTSLDDLLARPDECELNIDPATHHASLPVLIAQVEHGAFRMRERWEAVPADPYLARREKLTFGRPRLRAVTS